MPESGTSEDSWSNWPNLATLPELPRPQGRILVISAHPDDEVLGAGGLIASVLGASGDASTDIRFLTVTDGEASHPEATGSQLAALPELRAAELCEALAALGIASPDVVRLRLPDTRVRRHADKLAGLVADCLDEADWVLCPAEFDGHADHATVGRVAVEVCAGAVPLLQFPVWMWHWTVPGDGVVPWDRARRYELSVAEQGAKRAALDCFVTQVQPWPDTESGATTLPPPVLDHFARSFEVFFT